MDNNVNVDRVKRKISYDPYDGVNELKSIKSQSINSNVTLDSVLDWNNYTCLVLEQKFQGNLLNRDVFIEDFSTIISLLANFGVTRPFRLDINEDGTISTSDLLAVLSAKQGQPHFINKEDFTEFMNFGEGNTWFQKVQNASPESEDISFVWFHRTPYDDPNPENQHSYDNLLSFEIDVVMNNNTIYIFKFIRK